MKKEINNCPACNNIKSFGRLGSMSHEAKPFVDKDIIDKCRQDKGVPDCRDCNEFPCQKLKDFVLQDDN